MSKKNTKQKENPDEYADKKITSPCVHCGKESLKLVIPITVLVDSDKVLYECESCKERQYE